jgi:hypothetical protein
MNPDAEPRLNAENAMNDLKAQEDLLALKILGDPNFLDRVPYLMPAQHPKSSHEDSNALMSSDQLLDDLAQEVKRRVMSELELILPELIASCLDEVVQESSHEGKS